MCRRKSEGKESPVLERQQYLFKNLKNLDKHKVENHKCCFDQRGDPGDTDVEVGSEKKWFVTRLKKKKTAKS